MMIGLGSVLVVVIVAWMAARTCHLNDVDRDPIDRDLK
jgi:hypothetical protein